MYLLNAFSLNMLNCSATVRCEKTNMEHARNDLIHDGCESAVGHAETAAILSKILEFPVETQRRSIILDIGNEAIVAQYTGPRLEAGITELPPGAAIEFWHIYVDPTENIPF